jgi:hypothetical protein
MLVDAVLVFNGFTTALYSFRQSSPNIQLFAVWKDRKLVFSEKMILVNILIVMVLQNSIF